jgi:predicted Zn-dependent peptidase
VLLPDLAGDAGGLEVAPNAVLAAPRERAGSGDVTVRLRGLTQVRFAYGRPSLPENDPDYPAFLVADHVLGGHFYSRLHRALRHEGGETYAAYTVDLGDVVPDLYLLETFTRTANAAAAERKLREVLRRFHQGGIDEEEREDALGFLLGRPALRRQSPEQRLDRALRERRLGLPAGSDERAAERAATLSLAEINAFIARFFDPERFAMVRAEPRD